MTQTDTFNFTGAEQTWTVPNTVDEVDVELFGAGSGGTGGLVEGTITTTPGETLYLYVGGTNSGVTGGWPTGGDGGKNDVYPTAVGDGGAGGTDIRQNGNALSNRVAVAGGAGGGAEVNNTDGANGDSDVGESGNGGADTGQSGGDALADVCDANGGGGGTQSTAGSGGTASGGSRNTNGNAGSGANGANGVITGTASDETDAASGGGGGGFFGGGSGGVSVNDPDGGTDDVAAGGSGGGSNYTGGLASVASNQRGGGNSGDAQIVLTYEQNPQNLQATAIDGGQIDLSWDDDFTDEDGFNIYRAESSGGDTTADYTQIDSVGADITTYSDTGLENGEQYFYRITATDADGFGESGVSNESNAITDLPQTNFDTVMNV